MMTFRQVYEFWVTASTAMGEGEATTVVSQKTDSKGNAGKYFFTHSIKS